LDSKYAGEVTVEEVATIKGFFGICLLLERRVSCALGGDAAR
jgi:hypothetical protein